MIRAIRGPSGANLGRIEIVKGWVGKDGKAQAKIDDVACSDGPTITDRRCCGKSVGSTVDLYTANYTKSMATPFLERLGKIWNSIPASAPTITFVFFEITTPT